MSVESVGSNEVSVRQALSWRNSWQYDSSAKRLLTDLLASYELVAGAVFHAGYASLYEKDREFPGAPPQVGNDNYLMVNSGLFLKASYLRRF